MTRTERSEVVGLSEGQILDGRYRIEELLGTGGTAAVVAAHHQQLETKVAIKVLLPEMVRNEEAVMRFMREARAAARIRSEHVALVTDVGQMSDGAPYMVMEFLQGDDLAGWLEQRGPLPVEQAVEFLLQVCLAVAEAHRIGIVHRDLKPSNVFCVQRADGRLLIKVLDFGISKLVDQTNAPADFEVTRTTAVMGSPLYMSPEQMRSARSADERSDIWSLGVTAYEMLTGTTPFEGDTLATIAVNAATLSPRPICDVRPDVPLALQAAIFRCLEKDAGSRYGSVAELARALLPFCPGDAAVTIEAVRAMVESAAPAATEPYRGPASVPPLGMTSGDASHPRRRSVASVVALAGVAAIALIATFVRPERGAPSVGAANLAPVSSTEVAPATEAVPVPSTPAPTGSVLAAPSATASSMPLAPASTPASAAASQKAASATAAPRAAAAAKPSRARAGCDPNFELDAKGRKRFKPECFETP